MISSIIDAVLLTALAATSACVLLMYRRLRRFDVLQSEAAKAFVRSSQALENARAALDALHEQSGEMAVSLAARLNEARLVMNELESGVGMRRANPAPSGRPAPQRPAEPPPWPARHSGTSEPDLQDEWDDRFAGLAARSDQRRQRARRSAEAREVCAVAPIADAAALHAAPIAPSQALTLTWRNLADAARRTH